TDKPYRYRARRVPRVPPPISASAASLLLVAQHPAPRLPKRSLALHQAQERRRQRRKRRLGDGTLRVNDDVPSSWYLLKVATDDLAQPSAHAVAYHGAAERLLDAETEAAQGPFISANEHGEVSVGAALAGAIDRVKFALADQTRLARKRQALPRRWRCWGCPITREWGDDVPSCGVRQGLCGHPWFSCANEIRASWRGGASAVEMYALAKQSPLRSGYGPQTSQVSSPGSVLPPVHTANQDGLGVVIVKPDCLIPGSFPNPLVYLRGAHRVKNTAGYVTETGKVIHPTLSTPRLARIG